MVKPLIVTSINPMGTGGQVRNYYILKKMVQMGLIENGLLVVDNAPIKVIREFERLGFTVININTYQRILANELYLINLLSKLKKLKEERFDLVVSQSEHSKHIQAAYTMYKLFKIPWTVIVQSALWLDPFRQSLSPATIIRTLVSINLLSKTLVHVISNAIPQILGSRGFNLRFYSVLETPVGLEHEAIEQVLNETCEKTYDLAYMARIARGKGVLDLIYITHRLRRIGMNLKVLIIGEFHDEKLKEKFMKYAMKLNVLKDFTLAGYVLGREKYRLLSQARVFIYPSRVDIVPISLLEALAVGLPAVVLNYPFADLFKDGVAIAQNIEEASKLIYSLLLDEELRERLGRRAKAFSKRFTYEEAARCEYKAYLKTLEWFIRNAKA